MTIPFFSLEPEDPTSGTMASTSYGVFAVLVIFVENDQSLSHNWSVLHKAVHPNSCTRLRATYNCVSRNKPEDPTSGTMASTSYGVFAVLVIFVENDQSLSHNWSVLHKAVHPNSCTRLRATYNCVSRNKPEDPTSGTMASTSYGVFAVLVIFVENDQSLSHNWSVLHKANLKTQQVERLASTSYGVFAVLVIFVEKRPVHFLITGRSSTRLYIRILVQD
ncbi:hypothetical protein OS493_011045 [Desmophyllum pertusum]|uniref:Uncharacterized protein n=1 Tax=Desmophyllum pertusum TaxID=174260 RepID=A0A9X0CZN9_9CNID|nr:hypothetical protein OS493_011045 [Desmophyllum pertusum]